MIKNFGGSTPGLVALLGWVTVYGLVTDRLKPFRYITSTAFNSAFHPFGVDKSSTGLSRWR